jgi:hypothetical protein
MVLIIKKNTYLYEFSSTLPALKIMCAVTMDATMAIRLGCLRHRS